MTILSNKDIHERLGDSVIIHPFNQANVNTSSYDVTLGKYYFVERKPPLWRRLLNKPELYNIWDFEEVKRRWGEPREARSIRYTLRGVGSTDLVILLPPKHTILAHTVEFIGGRQPVIIRANDSEPSGLPSTTMMKARSSFGRNGIEVCKCAGYGDVGYINRWTMEITNNLHSIVPLVVGRRIAQIVFMETGYLENVDYTSAGKYQHSSDLENLISNWSPWSMLPRLDKDRDIKQRNNAIAS